MIKYLNDQIQYAIFNHDKVAKRDGKKQGSGGGGLSQPTPAPSHSSVRQII